MQKIDYLIIIVNYNSFALCKKAIESILSSIPVSDTFRICIYDNNSIDSAVIDELQLLSSNVNVLKSKLNRGYSKGNNEAIRNMGEKYLFKYIFIMNPDVEIVSYNIFSLLINTIEELGDDTIVGGQPLIWMPKYSNSPDSQINIRQAYNLLDIATLSFCFMRIIFKQRWQKVCYLEDMPYQNNLEYQIPSGCFFFIRHNVMKEINFFDEDTFLYNEELILGQKLKSKNYKLLFQPKLVVKHLHGMSTGQIKGRVRWEIYREEMKSRKVLLKHCYDAKPFIVGLFSILGIFDFLCRALVSTFFKKEWHNAQYE